MTEQQATWIVPGYVAEELVGFGASGEVWRGRAMDTGETVALKRLRAGAADHPRRRLEREAALLARIDHPHLLRVRELVSTEVETVLVLDHAAGGSLAMLLRRRGRLSPGEVVTVLAPVAAALAYAHDEGLVHGDVSPANVLFTAEGRPLLADLGVARVLGERDDPQCTPEYMDPAVAGGAAPGPASDIFMLAAVAVHALTGAPPWRADSPERTIALAATGRVPDLRRDIAEAPEALLRAVQRALSASPSERGSAAELALDMRHGCAPEPVRLVWPAGLQSGPDVDRVDAAGALTHAVRVPAAREGAAGPASSGSPRHRRHPRRLAASASDAWAAAPEQASTAPGGRSRSVRRGVGVGITLLLAALVGVAWGASGSGERPSDLASAQVASTPERARPTSTGRPTGRSGAGNGSAVQHWLTVLGRLDGVRALAYERGDATLLDDVYVPGRHLRVDSAQLRALASTGDSARGLLHRLGPLQVLAVSRDRVRLRAVQSLPRSQRLHRGHPAGTIPGSPQTTVFVELVATPAGWRLA